MFFVHMSLQTVFGFECAPTNHAFFGLIFFKILFADAFVNYGKDLVSQRLIQGAFFSPSLAIVRQKQSLVLAFVIVYHLGLHKPSSPSTKNVMAQNSMTNHNSFVNYGKNLVSQRLIHGALKQKKLTNFVSAQQSNKFGGCCFSKSVECFGIS